jgi:hypothetical protein
LDVLSYWFCWLLLLNWLIAPISIVVLGWPVQAEGAQCSFSGLHSCCIYCTSDLCIGFLCTDIFSLDSVQPPYVSCYVVVFCFPFFTSLSNIFPPSYLIKPSMWISKFPLQIKISTCICKFLLHALFTYPVFILEGPIHLNLHSHATENYVMSSSFQFSLVSFVLKLFNFLQYCCILLRVYHYYGTQWLFWMPFIWLLFSRYLENMFK